MKTAFWKADWFLGLVIAVALFGFARMSGFIPGLERWAYDLGVKMTSKSPSEKIAVIAIDEQSISNIGRWPWPREVQAKVIDQLAAAIVKALQMPEVKERFLSLGYEPTGTTPEALAAIMAADTARWGPIIKRSGFSE